MYWTARLTDANVRSRRDPLDEVLRQLDSLRGAWNEAVVRGARTEAAAPAGAAAGAPSGADRSASSIAAAAPGARATEVAAAVHQR